MEQEDHAEAQAAGGPDSSVGWLSIAGQTARLETVLDTPAARAEWLAPHRGRSGAVRCLCVAGGIALGVKYYEPYATYALYPLRREDPGRHAPDCVLGFPPGSRADLSIPLNGRPCIVERGGRYDLWPEWPLRRAALRPRSAASPVIPARSSHTPTVRRRAGRASLRTLLEVLWRLAGLHYWQPAFDGERDYATVAARLRRAAAQVSLRGHSLADWLYVPPPYRPAAVQALAAERAAWLSRLAPSQDGAFQYGYVLGCWRATERADPSRVLIALRHTPLRLRVSQALWCREAVRWRVDPAAEGLEWAPAGPVVWLAVVARQADELEVCELSALHLADERSWLPCESSHERLLIKRLVDDNRVFVKPLQAGGLGLEAGEVLPDIVLLDRRDRRPLEVLGRMADPAYAARWREKAAWYRKRHRRVWTWDPVGQPEMPPPPPPDMPLNRPAAVPGRGSSALFNPLFNQGGSDGKVHVQVSDCRSPGRQGRDRQEGGGPVPR